MRASIDGKDYVDVQEAAELAHYTPEHVRRLARQDKIESVRRGTMLFISLSSLEEYVTQMKRLGNEKFSPWRED